MLWFAVTVRIITRKTLEKFWKIYRDAEQPLKAWHEDTVTAKWNDPEDVRARYSTASVIGKDRVVFNIKGNRYRLIVAIKYKAKVVYIRFFGTHAEYDKIDASKV